MSYVNQAFLFRLIRTKEGLVFLPQDTFFRFRRGILLFSLLFGHASDPAEKADQIQTAQPDNSVDDS